MRNDEERLTRVSPQQSTEAAITIARCCRVWSDMAHVSFSISVVRHSSSSRAEDERSVSEAKRVAPAAQHCRASQKCLPLVPPTLAVS